MFIQGDIFKIEDKEYKLRYVNDQGICWLEPVLKRDNYICLTGGKNKIYHFNQLEQLEYMNICY